MPAGQLRAPAPPGTGGSRRLGVGPCPPRASGDWSPVHGHPGQLGKAGQHPSPFHLVPDEGQPHGHLVGDVPVGRGTGGQGWVWPATLTPKPTWPSGHRFMGLRAGRERQGTFTCPCSAPPLYCRNSQQVLSTGAHSEVWERGAGGFRFGPSPQGGGAGRHRGQWGWAGGGSEPFPQECELTPLLLRGEPGGPLPAPSLNPPVSPPFSERKG